MSVAVIMDQTPALQQQLTRARALAGPVRGAAPEAVAVELASPAAVRGVRGQK